MKIIYQGKVYEIDKDTLGEIGREAFNNMLNKEREEGVISTMGFYSVAASSGIPPCFACGDFVDYTGRCKYISKIKRIEDKNELNICKMDDVPLTYAIENGKLDRYFKEVIK